MFSFYRLVEELERIEEFKIDPSKREEVKKLMDVVKRNTPNKQERMKRYKVIRTSAKYLYKPKYV